MAFQTVFRRYELKYMLTLQQKAAVLQAMAGHMILDSHGKTTIRNIYFDTDNYRLIRRSIEKPVYKEKLRIRSYRQATSHSTVFVELKKKYDNVVYKRRLPLSTVDALAWARGEKACPVDTQISREIDYFIGFYGNPKPVIFLSYNREAYFDTDGSDFRVTFDDNILCRCQDVDLCAPAYGTPILEEGKVLMELKCAGGIPLWMVEALSRERIYKTAFSKYGTAYEKLIFPKIHFNQKESFSHGRNLSGNF